MSDSKEHHKQKAFCKTRLPYRQGKQLTAVKTYTVSNESLHLLVYGVPSLNLRNELKSKYSRFGNVLNIHVVQDAENEAFTECYHVQFERYISARIAKRVTDNNSFYGGILHVCYAPEYETVEETLSKLNQRYHEVVSKIERFKSEDEGNELKRKKYHS